LQLHSELVPASAPEITPEPVTITAPASDTTSETFKEPESAKEGKTQTRKPEEEAPATEHQQRPHSGSHRRRRTAYDQAVFSFASRSPKSTEPSISVTPVEGSSYETVPDHPQDGRGRPRRPSRILSSLLASTLGCTSTPLASPVGTSSQCSFRTPTSTPLSSSRSSTPMPPLIPKIRPGAQRAGISSQSTPTHSRASTPTNRPSSASKMSHGDRANWRCQSQSKVAPAPPSASLHHSRGSASPGPPLAAREPSESSSGQDSGRGRRATSLSSLAATSRLGVSSRPTSAGSCRPTSAGSCRPTSAGSSRSRSASNTGADMAWC
jgi:hypothetical protein